MNLSRFIRIAIATLPFLWLSLVFAQSNSVSPGFLVGAGFHVGQGKIDGVTALKLASEAGLDSFRDEVYWSRVQKSDGKLALSSDVREVAWLIQAAYKKYGIRAVIPLGYGNKFITGFRLPETDAEIEAYSKYCGFVAQNFSSSNPIYEIWNEWNNGKGAQPPFRKKGSVEKYVQLSQACIREIRKINPQSVILGGAVAGIDEDWILEYAKSGALKEVSGLSIHPYVFAGRIASAEFAIGRMDDIQRKVAAIVGRVVPFYITEMGWPTHTRRGGLSESKSALEISKFLVLAKSRTYIAGVWIYEMVDGGDDESDHENRFGLVRNKSYQYKSSFSAVQRFSTINRSLGRAPLVPVPGVQDTYRGQSPSGEDFVISWSNKYFEGLFSSGAESERKFASKRKFFSYVGQPLASGLECKDILCYQVTGEEK